METTVAKIKLALRITTSDFDNQFTSLIQSGLAELAMVGIDGTRATLSDPYTEQAVITYVCAHFGQPENYDQLIQAYESQVERMKVATGYTDWGE